MPSKKDIRKLTLPELEEFFMTQGEKKFRARQVYEWLWKKHAVAFSGMTSLSKATRQLLEGHFEIRSIKSDHLQKSADRTIKNAFRLYDHHLIEGVLIPTPTRMTACVSSQVGCSLTCSFCATGKMDRIRNLEAGEIYDQVVLLNRQAIEHYSIPLSNIVFMGMGEPLLNYANVMEAIRLITSEDGLNMSPQRITLSTAGIAKMIHKLGDDKVKFNLALSLHAAHDEKRNRIMPINESNNLEVLKDALKYFYDQAGTRVTFEYIVFHRFNDSLTDALELYEFAKHIPSKINLIEYNRVDGVEFRNALPAKIESFKNFLEKKGMIVNIRRSRGKDIDAACGQLANKPAVVQE